MPHISKIKSIEMVEIMDFVQFIDEYGHIFYDDPKILDSSFNKILEGINEIRKIVDDNYSI